MSALTIGEVARQTGVGVETVRFYERQGLIAPPPRRAASVHQAGYRQYPRDTVRRVRFIQRAKALGFSLKEIGELLALRVEAGHTAGDVKQRAAAKIADIDDRIQTLQRMRATLGGLVEACHGHGPLSDCPILEALEQERDEPSPHIEVKHGHDHD